VRVRGARRARVECVEVKGSGGKREGLGKVKQVKGRRVRLGRR